MIIGRTNGKIDVSILKNNDTTNEIQIVKCWFKTEFFKMIEIFIKYVTNTKLKINKSLIMFFRKMENISLSLFSFIIWKGIIKGRWKEKD